MTNVFYDKRLYEKCLYENCLYDKHRSTLNRRTFFYHPCTTRDFFCTNLQNLHHFTAWRINFTSNKTPWVRTGSVSSKKKPKLVATVWRRPSITTLSIYDKYDSHLLESSLALKVILILINGLTARIRKKVSIQHKIFFYLWWVVCIWLTWVLLVWHPVPNVFI